MTLVIDASAGVALCLAADGFDLVLGELHAPMLMRSEVLSAVQGMEWRKEISGVLASAAVERLLTSPVHFMRKNKLLRDARILARRLGWAKTYDVINPGDEVILFEPYYDSYRATLAMAGAEARFVTLRPPHFAMDPDELRAAFTSKTRAILVNTPHNPTGKVFTRDELEQIASLCREFDVIAISDEVYEHLVFEGEHINIATLDGMYERTVTLSSLGKTYSLTGWKIGWSIAPPELTAGVRSAHQFLTYAISTPLQHGAVAALHADQSYYEEFIAKYRNWRDLLVDGLARIGFEVYKPAGTYFVLADHTKFGFANDVEFCRHLVAEVGVAAIPPSAFYHDPADGAKLVRFAFCKDEATLREALQRMSSKL